MRTGLGVQNQSLSPGPVTVSPQTSDLPSVSLCLHLLNENNYGNSRSCLKLKLRGAEPGLGVFHIQSLGFPLFPHEADFLPNRPKLLLSL